MCKAWSRVNLVAFPCFSLFSKPFELFSLSKSPCSSFLSLCIASIAIQTTLQCWSLNSHLKRIFGNGRMVKCMTTLPVGGRGFRIRNVNFWEQSDSRTHEYYHSVGLAQARPKLCNEMFILFLSLIILRDRLGERSLLPAPPSLWPALEEFGRRGRYSQSKFFLAHQSIC